MRHFLAPFLLSTMMLAPMAQAQNIIHAKVDRSILPATSKFGYFGYIRAETGESVLPACFLEAGFFVDGLAIVEVGENTPPFLPGYAIIDSKGNTFLHGAAKIEPAYADKAGGYPFLVEGDGALSRVFVVYDKEAPPGRYYDKNYGEIGVYHADKGWLLPKSKIGRLEFINSVTFIYEGDLFIDGKKFPMPRGFMIDHVDFEDGYVRIRERGERKAPPKYGVLRLDGSVWVPGEYHDLTRAGNTGFWLASRYLKKTLSFMGQILTCRSQRKKGLYQYGCF